MNHSEFIAKLVVENLRRDCEMRYRVKQSNGEHDFDLFCDQAAVAAVEVTMATNPSKRRTRARISDETKGGPFINAVSCKKGWWVSPVEGADIHRIRENVDAYLAPIESTGVESFFANTDAAEAPAIYKIFRDLGIESGSVIRWKAPENRIAINFPIDGGEVKTRVLVDAILDEASKGDNRKKLMKIPSKLERHLFIYVDPLYFLPWKVLIDSEPTGVITALPREITHIWAATETRSTNEIAVWFALNGTRWQKTEITVPLKIEGQGRDVGRISVA